jgi:hypothetical protein
LSGLFTSLSLPALSAGKRWDVSQLYTSGAISVLPAFEADFDENGVVNAADLAIWRTGFGIAGGATHMQGDANADGRVDGADFRTWQRQLGSVATAPATGAVPEPSTAILVAIVMATSMVRRQLRQSAPR